MAHEYIRLTIAAAMLVNPLDVRASSDPLESVSTLASGEIETYEIRSDPGPCTGNEFEQFRAPDWASSDQVVRFRKAAEIAVRSTTFPFCECEVKYVESPWRGIQTFEVVHGSCMTLTTRVIGVDPDGNSYLLTGDLHVGWDGKQPMTSAPEALRNINRLANLEKTVIDSAELAQDYLESVLRVYMPRAWAYLPNLKVAEGIAAVPAFSPESDRLKHAYAQITSPAISVEASEEGFHGQAYAWHWCCGMIQRVDLRVSPFGQIRVVESTYALQK